MAKRGGHFRKSGQKGGSSLDSQDLFFRPGIEAVKRGGRFLSVGLDFLLTGQKEGSFSGLDLLTTVS